MSYRDCGWLCGSIGRGSLLLGPAEQCPQNREHRESEVCCHILGHINGKSLGMIIDGQQCLTLVFTPLILDSTLVKESSWSAKVKEMSGYVV